MHILITAGNTQAPIDRVRCITNIFTGRTGAAIAEKAWQRGHTVLVLTSHPETVPDSPPTRWAMQTYRTFDDLHELMAAHIPDGGFDAIIHCAAVSDYRVAGLYGADRTSPLAPVGKLKSDRPEMWLRLFRAPKLIDFVRTEWRFRGVLVKFKLEVGIGDDALLSIAESSRRHSDADLMVANTLEGAADWALLGPIAGRYERIKRPDLADRLLDAVTAVHEGR
ncbi:MAG TPA: phosphopantothenoylcysteine decarboxylase [Gemmataceae bacterium]|nr:phosphopantothenoylcysteine decarboxylase [Gemmataceae bacterium]